MRRMSAADSLFLYSDAVDVPMHLGGIAILGPPSAETRLSVADILPEICRRLRDVQLLHHRIREHPFDAGRPVLEKSPLFEPAGHVHVTRLAAPGTMRQLDRLASELFTAALDLRAPPWELWIIAGLARGRVALLLKLHHSLADGIAVLATLRTLFDAAPSEPTGSRVREDSATSSRSSADGNRDTGADIDADRWTAGLTQLNRLWSLSKKTMLKMAERASTQSGYAGPRNMRIGQLLRPQPLIINRPASARRAIVRASVPMADLASIKRIFGVSSNDVVLAAGALALRAYLRPRGPLPTEGLVCQVPVSKRRAGSCAGGNELKFVQVRLPMRITDPSRVLRHINRQTQSGRAFHAGQEDDLMGEWLEELPTPMLRGLVVVARVLEQTGQLPLRGNVSITHVPGPKRALTLAGARVESVHPIAPLGIGYGVNLAVMRYGARLQICITACPDRVPATASIGTGFRAAVRALKARAEGQCREQESGLTHRGSSSPRSHGSRQP